MRLTERLRRDSQDVWEAIINHPFVRELYGGSLPMEKFKYYIIQDYNYLITLTKCQALAASKVDDPGVMRRLLELALADVSTELENYNKLLGMLGLTIGDVVRARPNPVNVAYMSYMLSICSLGTAWECIAAILPCYWTYMEIADRLRGLLDGNPVDIYRSWASTYLTPEYRGIVEGLREIIDGRAGELEPLYERLSSIFRQCSIFEYMFWDAAYSMQGWPI